MKGQGSWAYLFAGFTTLFVSAFLDNGRGPVLPVLCKQLNIPYETAGLFLTIGNISAVIATFTLSRLLPKIGDRKAAIAVSWLAVIPGLLAPWVDDRSKLLLLGILLGAAVSLVGSLSSILAIRGSPTESRGRFMSIQQVMYGLGSLAAPLSFSILVSKGLDWWWLFTGASLVTFLLGCIYQRILEPETIVTPSTEEKRSTRILNRSALYILIMFSSYVAGEVLASMWMSSLMVDAQGLSPEAAARYQMGFFIAIGLTRFLCFLFVTPRWEPAVLIGCLVAGIIFAVLGQNGHSWALALIGLVGPYFPITMSRISLKFPENWKQMTLYVYLSMQIVLGLVHLGIGRFADAVGIRQAFLLTPACLVLCLILLIPFLRQPSPEVKIRA